MAAHDEAHWICTLIGHGRLNRLSQVLTRENSNLVDSLTGKTLLLTAIEKCQIKCVRLLLDRGAKANLLDKHGFSPIHHAACVSTPDIVEMLVDQEPAELNVQTRDEKYTPLMLAVRNGRPDIVAKLLQLQADRYLTDRHDRTALDIAKSRQFSECIRLFSNDHFAVCAPARKPSAARESLNLPRLERRDSEQPSDRDGISVTNRSLGRKSRSRRTDRLQEAFEDEPLDTRDERLLLQAKIQQLTRDRQKLDEERKELEKVKREEDEDYRRRVNDDFMKAQKKLMRRERTLLRDERRNAEIQRELDKAQIRYSKAVDEVLEREGELDERGRKLEEEEEALAKEKKSVEELRHQLETEREEFERERSGFEREK